MEHPFYSLSKKAETRMLRYEHGNVSGDSAERQGPRDHLRQGHPDLLHLAGDGEEERGEPLAQTLHLNAHELLVWTNRETSGDGYRRLKEAFERLSGTRVTTNIKANGEEVTEGFGLIESWRVVRETKSGRMNSTHMPRALVNVDELSELLSVAKGTLYQWVYLRRIPFVKAGPQLRFDPDAVIQSLPHFGMIGSAGKG